MEEAALESIKRADQDLSTKPIKTIAKQEGPRQEQPLVEKVGPTKI